MVLILAGLASSFAQFGAISSLNDVAHHFGESSATGTLRGAVGLSGSVLGLGLAVLRVASLGALPLAALADRRGRVPVIRTTLVVGLVATAAAALSPSYWFFVVAFALARPLLSAASTVVQVAVVETSRAANRVSRLALLSAGAGVGAGLSAVLHSVIRGPQAFRWLFALALLPALAMPRALRRVPEPREHDPDARWARLGAVPRGLRSRAVTVAVIAAAVGAITGPANGFAFVYGEGVLHLSPGRVATIVIASGLAGLGGLLLSRRLARSIGRRPTVAIGIVSLAATSLLAYWGGATDFAIGYFSAIGAAGLLAPAASALSTEIFPAHVRATTSGWVAVAGVVGATAGLVLFGWIGDTVGAHAVDGLRTAALITFLPLVPTIALLVRLPESAGVEIS